MVSKEKYGKQKMGGRGVGVCKETFGEFTQCKK